MLQFKQCKAVWEGSGALSAPKRKLFHIFWHICDQRPPASLARSSIGWDKKQDSFVTLLVVEETSNFPTLTHTHCHEEPRNSIHLIFIVVRPTSSRQIHTQEISFVLPIIAYLMWARPGKIKNAPKFTENAFHDTFGGPRSWPICGL